MTGQGYLGLEPTREERKIRWHLPPGKLTRGKTENRMRMSWETREIEHLLWGRENKPGAFYAPEGEQSGLIHTFQGRSQRADIAATQLWDMEVVALWGKSPKTSHVPHPLNTHTTIPTHGKERENLSCPIVNETDLSICLENYSDKPRSTQRWGRDKGCTSGHRARSAEKKPACRVSYHASFFHTPPKYFVFN